MSIFPASASWKQKALLWADASFQYVIALQNNSSVKYPYGGFPWVLACANHVPEEESLKVVETYFKAPFSEFPLFGFLGYDLKNQLEPFLFSHHTDKIGFPDAFFFIPEHLIYFYDEQVEIFSKEPFQVYSQIESLLLPFENATTKIRWQFTFSKKEYIDTVHALQNHIEEGDIYEINFCIEQFAEDIALSPVQLFERLQKISYNPFSAFIKHREKYALCASPERFLKKINQEIISQPIKGTSKRSPDPNEDERMRYTLQNSEKERSENMMITDLVRNDLARISQVGTVRVAEMFGVYSFPMVHQLISTVKAHLKPNASFLEILASTFPMGSMTGAPKIKAMELIEQYERTKRGLFSGSIGYILPNGDFDFNVVIRTLFYNKNRRIVSIQAGSAITYDASAEQEYEECHLKLSTISKVFLNFK
ncbi:MAG: anthranilate synthase component I family protein [Cytophagales bacterium]|nr:anthranilate synthase component I family protein [Cytophagales bacterium]MDW8384457.1 anthranilate synthase component I family protein [Flammeovirgaceae bacterium]